MSMHRTKVKMPKGDNSSLKENTKALGKVAVSTKKYWPFLFLSVFFLLVTTVIAIISPHFLDQLTQAIADGAGTRSIDMDEISRYGVILICLYVGYSISNYLASFIVTSVIQRYANSLRKDIVNKINRVPLSYFDSREVGDILSIVTNDVDTMSQSLDQVLGMLLSSIFMLVGSLIGMFVTSWQMALVACLSIPLMALFLVFIMKLAMPQFMKRQNQIGALDGRVEESYSGQSVLKAFRAEEKYNAAFDKQNRELGETMFKAQICGGLMMPSMTWISYLTYVAVLLVGGILMTSHPETGIEFGTLTAFLVYVRLFQQPFSQIGQVMNSLQTVSAASARVFAFLGEKEISDETGKPFALKKDGAEEVKGSVNFEDVHFGYEPGREIIHGFSAVVKPGSKVAIVGPTGAGKTTIVNLLMRFYETDSGDILIDGVKTSDMPRKEIHDVFGMVLQDTWVFNGTLRENLVYNTKGVTEEDIQNVIHDAHLTHFVRSLPGGLDYVISDGSQISGGQKQLITIARAMLRKSPLMILDEATSNVDTRTEEKLQEAMDRLTKGKTSFVIAHRLSTIRNSDLILVLKDGDIVEKGTHDSLMKEGGFYSSIYNSQFSFE